MQTLAFKAYGKVEHRTAGDRNIEHALFRQITEQMLAVKHAADPTPTEVADAINRNLQMWTTLATDLMSEENGHSNELKGMLLGINAFVRRTSMQLLSGEGDLADLIEVNQIIMQGLQGASVETV